MKKNPWVSFDKLSEFEQKMLLKDNIDIDEITNLRLTAEILRRYQIYVLMYLVTDVQFILYKGYLYNLYGREFSDEEVYSMASQAISKKLNYKENILGMVGLPKEYIDKINHDLYLISALKSKGLSVDLKEMKLMFPKLKAMVYYTSEKSCIDNLNLKYNLNKIGLEDYAKKVITRILGEESNSSLSENTTIDDNAMKLTFNISKTKTPIKKLIKKYNK